MAAPRKRFSTAPVTAPTAGEPVTASGLPDVSGPGRPAFVPPGSPDVPTPRVPEVKAPVATLPFAVKSPSRPDVQAPGRIAFTWRLTPEQADQLDTLVLGLRRQLGRGRLDRAAVLQALVDLTAERPDVQEDVVKRLLDV